MGGEGDEIVGWHHRLNGHEWRWWWTGKPGNEYSGLISFRIDWFDLLAVQGTLKSLFQHHSSKASILQCSAFFTVHLSHPYMTTGKTMALTRRTFVGKDMSLPFFFFLVLGIFFFLTLFYFTILYWFCHTLTWIHHGCTCNPKHEPPSHLPPHNIPLGHPRAPAPSMLYPASDIDWWFNSYMIVYMFQCHSPKSSHPLPLSQSPKVCSTHLCLFCCLAYRVIIAIFLNSIYMC